LDQITSIQGEGDHRIGMLRVKTVGVRYHPAAISGNRPQVKDRGGGNLVSNRTVSLHTVDEIETAFSHAKNEVPVG
jgi:hypothetical protein